MTRRAQTPRRGESPAGADSAPTLERMKALTVPQPWASLIALGHKHIITLDYPTKHRGTIAIHAGRSDLNEGMTIVEKRLTAATDAGDALTDLFAERFHMGAIIATADLFACVKIQEDDPIATARPGTVEGALGDYTDGMYAWLVSEVYPCEPHPCRGAEGLWDLPADVREAIHA